MPFRGLRSPGIGDLDPKESGGGQKDPLGRKKIGDPAGDAKPEKKERHIHERETILRLEITGKNNG